MIDYLKVLLEEEDIKEVRRKLTNLKPTIKLSDLPSFATLDIVKEEIQQIIDTFTLDRQKYYIKRLIKGLTVTKYNKLNNINLNRWKEYKDLLTDSLWIFKKRKSTGKHSAGYHGNFIPQIPYQLFSRFTKKGDWVLDTFLGSGTSLIECKNMGRNGVGVEISEDVAEETYKNIKDQDNPHDIRTEIINDDCTSVDYKKHLDRIGIDKFQFVIMHPPYWDIIKFSDEENDLSNTESMEDFLILMGKAVDNAYDVLEKGKYLAIIIGDKYNKGEWIPLSSYVMTEVMKRKFKLKSVIVKNFEDTKAKMNKKDLWRYRALVGGFYVFKHEYIYLFQKK